MGRPSKLTAEVALAIVESVGDGSTVEDAARAAGVDRATVFRWTQRGASTDPKDGTYRDFRDALLRARGTARRALVGSLYRAAIEDRDTRAAALWLEVTDRAVDALEGSTAARAGRELDEMTVQAVLALVDGADEAPVPTNGNGRHNGNGNGNGHH